MSGPGRAGVGPLPASLLIAIGLSLGSLGLRWTSTTRGYQLDVRVLLAGAVASLVAAAIWWRTRPDGARRLLTVAVVLLSGALALRLRGIQLSALVAVCGAIAATVVARRRVSEHSSAPA